MRSESWPEVGRDSSPQHESIEDESPWVLTFPRSSELFSSHLPDRCIVKILAPKSPAPPQAAAHELEVPPISESATLHPSAPIRMHQRPTVQPVEPLVSESLREQRRFIYHHEQSQWNAIETTCGLGATAWAAKEFASVGAAESGERVATAVKERNMAHGFSAALVATAAELGIDRVVAPEEQKMEATLLSDCLLTPICAISRGRWFDKVGWMVAAHMLGRLIDHYRQPVQHF